MKRITITTLLLCLMALIATGCDDVSQEPRFTYRELTFESEGGTRPNVVIEKRVPWHLIRVSTLADNGVTIKSYELKELGPVRLLADGSYEFDVEWATFRVARYYNTVYVTVKENTTGKLRKMAFDIHGKMNGDSFEIIQNP